MKWITKSLGELTSFISKGIAPKYVDSSCEHSIHVLNQKCNRNFKISYDESRYHDVCAKKVPDEKKLQLNDVIINSTGTGTAGRVAQINVLPYPTTVDGHMIILRTSSEMDPLYFGYAVKLFQSKIESLAEGSTGQTEINRTRLKNEILITYPDNINVQHYIGRFLADLDDKITLNNAINCNLYLLVLLITILLWIHLSRRSLAWAKGCHGLWLIFLFLLCLRE